MLNLLLMTLAEVINFDLMSPLRTGLKVVAVVGGAVMGGLLSRFLFGLIARVVFKQQTSRLMKRTVGILGAIAVGLAISKLPIGFGDGFGWGGGSGTGSGTGAETDAERLASQPDEPTRAHDFDNSRTQGRVVRIEMLGGEQVRDEKFYLLEGDNSPKTLAEVRSTLRQRQPPPRGIEIVIRDTSVAQNHPAVRDLERWARQHNFTVTLLNKNG